MGKSFNPAEASKRHLLKCTLQILREHGFKPRKRLSQNFIVDPALIREILSYVDAKAHVLEIGCGIGTLSKALTSKVQTLLCIEVDSKLCNIASGVVDSHRFVVVNGDARVHAFTRETIVSNIPYHITSDILVKISRESNVTKAVLTVQKEVVDRLLAEPGSKEYGKLTVLARTLFTIRSGGVYPPSSFYPRPEVHSQVVVLTRIRQYTSEIKVLEKITRILFSQRKRRVEKVLESAFSVKLRDLGFIASKVEGKRVFMVPPELWLELSRSLIEKGVLA